MKQRILHCGLCLVWMLLLKGGSSLVVQLGDVAQEILLQYQTVKFLRNKIDKM